MKRSGVADMSHRIAGHRYVVRVRCALVGGVAGLGVIARRLSFPSDSLVLLALLLAANLLRIYLPGPVTDGVFGMTVLFLALSLFREPFPASARTTALCFAVLLTVYAVGLLVEFSIQGASNLAGILFAGIIFLFCWRNAPTLIRAKYVIPLLLTAASALFPLYLLPTEFNPHGIAILLSYLLLTVGLIVIARSDNRKSQHWWAHGLFLLVALIATIFGYRSLVLAALLAYPLYWSGYFFLRNRLGAGLEAATAGLLICFPIVFLGTPYFSEVMAALDSFSRKYTGNGIQTGRETLWRHSLAAISESPWLGHGPGAVVTRLTGELPTGKAGDAPPAARPSDLDPSCMDYWNPGLLEDCAALLEARNALDGGSRALGSWKPSRHLRDWRGVKVGGAPPRVVALNLPKPRLRGVVPPELGRLDKLDFLRLSNNALTGPIPSELGRLRNLRLLALDDNALSGPVPPQLGALENLEELWLRGNRLSGEVPLELANLTNLSLLRLAGNDFSGTVPPALHDTADHDLDQNLYCLPSPQLSKGLLADCETLLAARDALAGNVTLDWKRARPIAAWQGVAVGEAPGGIRVVGLDLTGLGLSGRLPPALGALDGLVSLRLGDNRLTGSIPPELGKLAHLRELRLANNRLSGGIPPELGRPFGLSILRLAGNDFAGGLPPTLDHVGEHDWGLELFCLPAGKAGIPSPGISTAMLEDCTALLEARDVLAGDAVLDWKRSRPIGTWQGVKVGGAPARVIGLDLPKKDLRGTLPPELGHLNRLELLRLSNNALTGPIPPELGRLRNLWVLRLAGNDFSGAVPQGLYEVADHDLARDLLCLPGLGIDGGLLIDCNTLLAVRGVLAGDAALDWKRSRPISAWLGVTIGEAAGDARVVDLDLTGLELSGRIPPALGGLDQLMSLRLAGNRLTGSIPPELGKLAYLKELWLNGNELSGDIPSELAMLANLSSLRLAGNDFTGAAPSALRHVAAHDLDRDRHCRRAAPRSNPGLVHDCAVLLTARDVLAGEATLGWSDEIPIEFWQGVTVAGMPARVVELNLPSMALTGIVPPVLSELDRLAVLRLGRNRLTGAIPPGLGSLAELQELLLGDNALTGAIPPKLGDLESLTLLHLYDNQLTGPIPPELGNLHRLRGLSLASNRLTGSIPAELGRLQNLRWLNLWSNRLSGRIPSALRRLENLESVRLSHNDFIGAAPGDFGRDDADPEPASPVLAGRHDPGPSGPTSPRTNPDLRADHAILLAARDTMAGAASLNWDDSTPLEYWEGVVLDGAPARVTGLTLREKGLSGRIPPALSELDRLAVLRLHRNRLTGAIPPELGRLTHLRELVLGSNALSGPIPPPLGDLEQLALLHLRRNRLTGPVPRELAGLTNLRILALDFNALSGPVPRELAKLPNLEELRLAGNRVDIPPELAILDQPPAPSPDDSSAAPTTARRIGPDLFCPPPGVDGDLAAQADNLVGDCTALLAAEELLDGGGALNWSRATPVNAWQGVAVGGEPPRVFALDLSRAGLTGAIPPELGQLQSLVWLHLSDNALTGPIPSELGRLSNLRVLALDDNALSGAIPSELGSLANLEEMSLRANRLTGPIPPELEALTRFSALRLGGNQFSGCIPWELQDMADRELKLDLLCDPSMGSGRGLREDAIALMEMRNVLAGSARLNWSYASPISAWEGVTVSPVRPAGRGARGGAAAQETKRVVGLDLSGMGLDGRLPAALAELDQLIWLRLNDNRLTGPIPPELGQIANLRELGLEANALTGPIPPQLGQIANLSELWLGDNRLSGAIPPELASLDALSVLHLRGNELTGCLPPLGQSSGQPRARPDGLPGCGAAPDPGFASLGDVVKRINAAVDPLTFETIPASAHNLYLQVGVQTGVFGLGALMLLCASLIFNLRARSGAQVTPLHCYAAACTIAVLICETFDVYLLQNAFAVGCIAWILIGLGAGVVNHLPVRSAQAGDEPAGGGLTGG